jgi:hypothetical protein
MPRSCPLDITDMPSESFQPGNIRRNGTYPAKILHFNAAVDRAALSHFCA